MLFIKTNPYPAYMNRVKSPCLDCRMRNVGCHGVCVLYESYKDDLSILRNKTRENINSGKSPRSYDYYKWRNSYCNGRKANRYYG